MKKVPVFFLTGAHLEVSTSKNFENSPENSREFENIPQNSKTFRNILTLANVDDCGKFQNSFNSGLGTKKIRENPPEKYEIRKNYFQ